MERRVDALPGSAALTSWGRTLLRVVGLPAALALAVAFTPVVWSTVAAMGRPPGVSPSMAASLLLPFFAMPALLALGIYHQFAPVSFTARAGAFLLVAAVSAALAVAGATTWSVPFYVPLAYAMAIMAPSVAVLFPSKGLDLAKLVPGILVMVGALAAIAFSVVASTNTGGITTMLFGALGGTYLLFLASELVSEGVPRGQAEDYQAPAREVRRSLEDYYARGLLSPEARRAIEASVGALVDRRRQLLTSEQQPAFLRRHGSIFLWFGAAWLVLGVVAFLWLAVALGYGQSYLMPELTSATGVFLGFAATMLLLGGLALGLSEMLERKVARFDFHGELQKVREAMLDTVRKASARRPA